MADNRINVAIGGIDLLSGHLRSWVPRWKSQASKAAQEIGGSLKGAFQVPTATLPKPGSQSGSLLFDVLGGNLLANLITGSITGAIGLAQRQIANIQGSLMEASRMETMTIASASQLSSTLGVNIERAKVLTKDLRLQTVDIADQYIGDTQTYTDVLEAISPMVGELFRGNEKGFTEAVLDMTKRTGAIGATKGISGVESGNTINRLLMGTMGIGEAMQLDLLQKTSLGKALYDSVTRAGISQDDWKKLSSQARYQIINDALRRVATDDMLAQFEDTTEGYLEVLKTRLFNPDVGIFGFLRAIPAANGRSVLDSFRGFLQNFVILWDNLAELGEELGLSFDPLMPLVRFFDWLTDITIGINRFLGENQDTEGLFEDIPGKIGAWLGDLASKAIAGIASTGLRASQWFTNIDWSKVTQIAFRLVDGLTANLGIWFRSMGNMFRQIDWGKIGAGLIDAVWLAIKLLGYGFIKLPWGDIIFYLFQLTNGLREAAVGAILRGTGLVLGAIADLGASLVRWVLGIEDSSKSAVDQLGQAIDNLFRNLTNLIPGAPSASQILGIPSATADKPKSSPGLFDVNPLDIANPIGLVQRNVGNIGTRVGEWLTGSPEAPQANLSVPGGERRATGSTTFAPQINLQSNASDPEELANLVMSRVDRAFRSYQAAQLA